MKNLRETVNVILAIQESQNTVYDVRVSTLFGTETRPMSRSFILAQIKDYPELVNSMKLHAGLVTISFKGMQTITFKI